MSGFPLTKSSWQNRYSSKNDDKKKETLYEKEIYGSCPVHSASDRKYGGMREGRFE